MQVVTDPMASVVQSLHSILVAELVDNEAWDDLVSLAEEVGQQDMVQKFQQARDEERRHLSTLRQWYQQATMQEARLLS